MTPNMNMRLQVHNPINKSQRKSKQLLRHKQFPHLFEYITACRGNFTQLVFRSAVRDFNDFNREEGAFCRGVTCPAGVTAPRIGCGLFKTECLHSRRVSGVLVPIEEFRSRGVGDKPDWKLAERIINI